MPTRRNYDLQRVNELCGMLIKDGRGKMLGDEIMAQVGSGYIQRETYDRLSRWAHPEREERDAQPVAENLSYELFGFVISRVNEG